MLAIYYSRVATRKIKVTIASSTRVNRMSPRCNGLCLKGSHVDVKSVIFFKDFDWKLVVFLEGRQDVGVERMGA